MPRDCSGSSHCWRNQMSPSLVALASFEVSIGRRSTTFSRRELVGVHCKTHRAARLAPVETGGREYLVEAFGFRLQLHETRARHYHGADIGIDAFPVNDTRDFTQILDAR